MVKKGHVLSFAERAAVLTAVLYYGAFAAAEKSSAGFPFRNGTQVLCAAGMFFLLPFCLFCLIRKRRRTCVLPVFCFFLAAVCLYRFQAETAPPATLVPEKHIDFVEGTVAGNPVSVSEGKYYIVPFELSGAGGKKYGEYSASGHCRLLVPAAVVEALYPGRLYSEAPRSPDGKTEAVPLFEKGLYARMDAKAGTEPGFFIASRAVAWRWPSAVMRIRALLRLQLKRLLYQWGAAGAFLLALVSSSREYLDRELSEGFTRAGLAHILALSGMHLSLVGGAAVRAGRRIGGKKLSVVCSVTAMLFFVWFAGASPSLTRALVFSFILTAGAACGLNTGMTGALAASFLIQVFLFPADAFSVSFILSYGALAGILTVGEKIAGAAAGKIPPCVASPVSASAGAQIATAPVTAAVCGKIVPAGIAASVFVSPLAALFLLAGMACVFLCLLFPFLTGICGAVLGVLYTVISAAVLFFSGIPLLSLENGRSFVLFYVIYSSAAVLFSAMALKKAYCLPRRNGAADSAPETKRNGGELYAAFAGL